jgi:hypothetical protein
MDTEPAGARPGLAVDCAFVAVVAAVVMLPFVWRLGFYSDDWWFLSVLARADGSSLAALYRAIAPEVSARPVQAAFIWPFCTACSVRARPATTPSTRSCSPPH